MQPRAAVSSPWRKSGVAPRAAMRPDGKARRVRIPGVCERGATPPGGMQRRPNAAGLSPRAAGGSPWRALVPGSGARDRREQIVREVTAMSDVNAFIDAIGKDVNG